jgi:hypothetical protein
MFFSAKGAHSSLAWGNAPGRQNRILSSAEGAIHSDTMVVAVAAFRLSRAFSAWLISSLGPGAIAPGFN